MAAFHSHPYALQTFVCSIHLCNPKGWLFVFALFLNIYGRRKTLEKQSFLVFYASEGTGQHHLAFWHGLRILAQSEGKSWRRGNKSTGHLKGMHIVTQLRDAAFGLCGTSNHWGQVEARRQKPPKEPEPKDIAKLIAKATRQEPKEWTWLSSILSCRYQICPAE